MAKPNINTRNKSTKRNMGTITTITPEARKRLIAEEAYRLAEQREFKGDYQLRDWLESEAKIDHIYGKAQ